MSKRVREDIVRAVLERQVSWPDGRFVPLAVTRHEFRDRMFVRLPKGSWACSEPMFSVAGTRAGYNIFLEDALAALVVLGLVSRDDVIEFVNEWRGRCVAQDSLSALERARDVASANGYELHPIKQARKKKGGR